MTDNLGSAQAIDDRNGTIENAEDEAARIGKSASSPSLNMTELHELAELIDEHGFTDFEFENENIRVRMSKNPAPSQIMPMVQPLQNMAAVANESAPEPRPEPNVPQEESLAQILSPIVGTFYRAPSPDKDPYVKEGTIVSPGTVVCIVEAMKLMNEIEAEISGEVVKIYVENGQPVEYGQPLFGIRN